MTSALVIGTAQLGMAYGIANTSGQPDAGLATEIVKTAWDNDIRVFDTAQGYGDSERVLGKAIKSLGIGPDVRVVTKLDPNINHLDGAALETAVKESRDRLEVPVLHGLMLHREELLNLWESGLGDTLNEMVISGLCRHAGASVYSPESAMTALGFDELGILQVPSNIFDRRFETAGVFAHALHQKKQLFVRGVFLQGLALMPVEQLPPHMRFAAPLINRLDGLCNEVGLTRQGLALGYARYAYPDAKVLIGVETPEQLVENIACWNASLPGHLLEKVPQTFNRVAERILNPALWN